MEYVNDFGKVSISTNVIETISSNVLKESYGVCGLVNTSTKDGFYELLGWENSNKGVNVDVKDNAIIIDLSIIIQYGIKISVVCENIINNVKYNVENLTGLKVESVNVNVHGIIVQD